MRSHSFALYVGQRCIRTLLQALSVPPVVSLRIARTSDLIVEAEGLVESFGSPSRFKTSGRITPAYSRLLARFVPPALIASRTAARRLSISGALSEAKRSRAVLARERSTKLRTVSLMIE